MKTIIFIVFSSSVALSSQNKNQTFVLNSSKPLLAKAQTNPSVFNMKESLNILNNEPRSSLNYKNETAVVFSSVHNGAGFETLKLLANTYKEKGDFKNQIRTLEVLTSQYNNDPKSHFLLGKAYKELWLEGRDASHRNESVKHFQQSIEKAKLKKYNHESAYIHLLFLVKEYSQNTYLGVAQEMLRYFKKPEYYTELCEAYFVNHLFMQSRSSCKKAMQKNPSDPRGEYYYILSKQTNPEIKKELIQMAQKFSNSYFVQFKTGRYFTPIDKAQAIKYYEQAIKIKPDSAEAHKDLAWLLFKTNREDESYESFYQACSLEPKLFLKDFTMAQSRIRNKKGLALNLKFKKGVALCHLKYKKKKSLLKN